MSTLLTSSLISISDIGVVINDFYREIVKCGYLESVIGIRV